MKLKMKQATDNDRVMIIPKEIHGARKIWVHAVHFFLTYNISIAKEC